MSHIHSQVKSGNKNIFLNTIMFLIILFIFSSQNAFGQHTVTYNTPGNQIFTVPAGVSKLTVEVWGAGA